MEERYFMDRPKRIEAIEIDENGFPKRKVRSYENVKHPDHIVKEKPNPKLKKPKWDKKTQQWVEHK